MRTSGNRRAMLGHRSQIAASPAQSQNRGKSVRVPIHDGKSIPKFCLANQETLVSHPGIANFTFSLRVGPPNRIAHRPDESFAAAKATRNTLFIPARVNLIQEPATCA